MEVLNGFVEATESNLWMQTQLWMWMSVGTVFFAFTNFAYMTWQIIPLLGSKGIYSSAKKQAVMKKNFTLRRRMLHFPSTWFGILGLGYSDTALRFYPVYGMLLTGSFIALELLSSGFFAESLMDSNVFSSQLLWYPLQVILLWMIWFCHTCFSELVFMPFPWHSLMNESLFVLSLSYTTMLDTAGVNGGAAYSRVGVAAIRMLLFRVLFGFGKFKFIGAKWSDWKYIKGFMPSIPVVNPAGPLFHRYLPDFGYAVAYFLFFVSEIVAPFFYFATSAWYRVVAAILTAKLMFGILLSGNFGNFNLIVIVLCLASPLPVSGTPTLPATAVDLPWWYNISATVAYWALVLHIVSGILVLPFNSWVQSSWFAWPSLVHAGSGIRKYCACFEVMTQWRVMHPYGIFPPNTFPAQRNMTLYEGSADGKTWKPYRYHHQPTEDDGRPSLIPGLHPWMDFVMFYQIGNYGFMESCTYMIGCINNFECRPIDAIARNLLEGGDGADLFKSCPFPKTQPPKYIRAVQMIILPAEQGSPHWWKVSRGTLELPATSLSTMETLIPKVYVSDPLTDSEPAMWVWRDRTRNRLDLMNRFMPEGTKDQRALAALRYLAAEERKLSPACRDYIEGAAKGCETLAEVMAYCDKQQHYIEMPELRQGLHRLAMVVADVLVTCGWPWHGENKARIAELRKGGKLPKSEPDPLPVSMVQLYCFVLWLLANPEHLKDLKAASAVEKLHTLLLQQVEGPFAWYQCETPLDPEQVHAGLRLFVGMFPRTVRLESSIFRRWKALGLVEVKRQEERGPDMVLPGFQAYWRSLFPKAIPFFPRNDSVLSQSVNDNTGGCWGPENLTKFKWDPSRYEFVFDKVEESNW